METNIIEEKPLEIYPHCVVCGIKADSEYNNLIYMCDKHAGKWSEYFSSIYTKSFKKKQWIDSFKYFLSRETKQIKGKA